MTSWKLTGCTCFQTFDLGTNSFGAESYLSNFVKFGIFITRFWTWDSALFCVFLTVKGLSLRTSCFVLRYSWRPRLVSLPVWTPESRQSMNSSADSREALLGSLYLTWRTGDIELVNSSSLAAEFLTEWLAVILTSPTGTADSVSQLPVVSSITTVAACWAIDNLLD